MKTLHFIVLSLSLLACSSSSEGTSGAGAGVTTSASSSDPDSFLDAVCTKLNSCNAKSDVQTCKASFDDATIARLRADYMSAVAACITGSDCASIGDRTSDCFDEALVDITPTAAVKSFCTAFVAAAEHCDASVKTADCLKSYEIYADDHVAKLEACTTKSCSTMVRCLEAETK